MTDKKPITSIVFDLGNVILPFDHKPIMGKLADYCKYSPEQIRAGFFKTDVVYRYGLGQITSEEFFDEIKQALTLQCDFEDFSDIFCDIFTENAEMKMLVERLAEKYPLFLLSDTNELHFEYVLKNYPVLEKFQNYSLSYEIGEYKPHEMVYRDVIRKSKTEPEALVFVDDLEANTKGAEKAGIHGVWFQNYPKLLVDLAELGIQVD